MGVEPTTWDTVLPRLLEKIDVRGDDDCWPWTGAKTQRGHGYLRWQREHEPLGRMVRVAHALMWEQANQAMVLRGYCVEHLCFHAWCCNPAHLSVTTNVENISRPDGMVGIHRAKTHCPQGHEYTPENTYKNGNHRKCKTCTKERAAEQNRRRRTG